MKRIILSLIKMLSVIIIITSSVLFFMTFFNQSYFTWLWEVYLKSELNHRIESLDNKIESVISEESKARELLDKFKLSDKVGELKDKIKEKSLVKTDEIVNKAFNAWADEMKDISLFWKSLIEEVKSIINNFILDIRIFLITNMIWFWIIYLLMFYRKRADIIRNMFFIIVIIFLVMIFGLFYYIIWQDWVTNIVTNSFIWYWYPILIVILILFFIYSFRKTISKEDEKYIEEAKTWKFYWSIKDLKEPTSVKIIKWIYFVIVLLIELILNILFLPFNV